MRPFENPAHEGNLSSQYMTGKRCLVAGCMHPAGTAWSPLWCVLHNISRMSQIESVYRAVDHAVQGASHVQ
jgi:hypothetical protein